MKKIIAFILCLMILCVPILATAEGGDVTEGEASGDISTPEVDVPTEGEILPPVESPEETPEEVPEETPKTDPKEETEPPVEIPEEIPEETPEEIPEQKPEETPKEEPTEKPEETPPVEEPPVEEAPPTEEPPIEEVPPVEEPPVETPKEERPNVETPPTETPEETPTLKSEVEEEIETLTASIRAWFERNSALIGLIVTIIGYGFATFKKLGTVSKTTGTLNNNAVTIARATGDAVVQARECMTNAAQAVTEYKSEIAALLEAFKITAEEKQNLERELVEIKNYLKTSTDANIEFANELADLIALANIPNYKKEELGSTHTAHVKAIVAAMEKAVTEAEAAANMLLPITTEEVKENVGEEA